MPFGLKQSDMILAPFENLTYTSSLSEKELIESISENIEPKRAYRKKSFGKSNTKPYEGSINGSEFKVNRIINYRNSFIPIISGFISQTTRGSRVMVKMRLHAFVYVFMAVWLGATGYIFSSWSISSLTGDTFELEALMPLGMLVFGYLLATISFQVEAIKAKKDLAKILQAKIEETPN